MRQEIVAEDERICAQGLIAEEEPDVKDNVRQVTDSESESPWAGCLTPTRRPTYHAESAVKERRPQRGSAASHSVDKGSDSDDDDDAEGASSGHVSSGSDDMTAPCLRQ